MSENEAQARRRVSLTKRQLAEEQGSNLLSILCEVTADGKLSDEEVSNLGDWLLKNKTLEYPAVGLLLEVLARVLADGAVSDEERLELHLAIEKTLPVTERAHAKQKRADQAAAEAPPFRDTRREGGITRSDIESGVIEMDVSFAREEAPWRSDPATDAQRKFLRSLGGTLRSGASKGEASDTIDSLLGNKPLSNRQLMVLRFWNRSRVEGEDKRAIIDWLDQFYSEDPDRKRAWELYKEEAEDDGLQGDAERVPLGIGPEYLARVKNGGPDAIPRFRRGTARTKVSKDSNHASSGRNIGTWLVMLALVIALIIKLVSAYSQ